MQKILFNLERYTQPVKAPKYYWQQIALDTLEYIESPTKSQIFRWAKRDEGKLKSAIEYMRYRKIRNFKYLAAMMSRNAIIRR